MCGICGWIDTKPIEPKILEKMSYSLYSRGPDAQNTKVINKNIGLGHTRLSIIDLSTSANQPIANEDNSIWLVYNGEFYNFKEYQAQLIKSGHKFKSNSDSEVVLHLYEEYGLDFIHKLRGMFAFALWDNNKQQLLLVRDRVGIKPLYFYFKNNTFLFGSELKALLYNPYVSQELSLESLHIYFILGYIPAPFSVYKDIYKLKPGHYLILKNNSINIHKYWQLPSHNPVKKITIQEYEKELYNLLNESIKLRLVSDVPVGVLLSGGLDSSIVATLMAQNTNKTIKTFSIGFEEKKFNEIPFARQIARHINSEHYEFFVKIDNLDLIDDIINYYDEPFADSSAIPTFYVSKMARQHVKVVLSGDGGDELFAGYNWYSWVLMQNKYKFLPPLIRKTISSLSAKLNTNFPSKNFCESLYLNEQLSFLKRTAFFMPYELNKLFNNKIIENNFINQYISYYQNTGITPVQRMTRTDFKYYLPDDILTKVDRASMKVSLETRVPILDHKICNFAFSLPDNLRITIFNKKIILKNIAQKLLPENYKFNRKHGFNLPINKWFDKELGEKYLFLTNNSSDKLINKDFAKKLFFQYKKGNKIIAPKLWAILIFLIWFNKNK